MTFPWVRYAVMTEDNRKNAPIRKASFTSLFNKYTAAVCQVQCQTLRLSNKENNCPLLKNMQIFLRPNPAQRPVFVHSGNPG
jgi:hypothetical protein